MAKEDRVWDGSSMEDWSGRVLPKFRATHEPSPLAPPTPTARYTLTPLPPHHPDHDTPNPYFSFHETQVP